jgi:hypothetical protein
MLETNIETLTTSINALTKVAADLTVAMAKMAMTMPESIEDTKEATPRKQVLKPETPKAKAKKDEPKAEEPTGMTWDEATAKARGYLGDQESDGYQDRRNTLVALLKKYGGTKFTDVPTKNYADATKAIVALVAAPVEVAEEEL